MAPVRYSSGHRGFIDDFYVKTTHRIHALKNFSANILKHVHLEIDSEISEEISGI
jgi:hypothetical protein